MKQEAYQEFLQAYENGKLRKDMPNYFLDADDYEYDYSHKEIEEAQEELIDMIREKLKDDDNWLVGHGIECVIVISKEINNITHTLFDFLNNTGGI